MKKTQVTFLSERKIAKNTSFFKVAVKNRFLFLIVLFLTFTLFVSQGQCEITLLDGNYQVETYIQYQQTSSMGRARYMAADGAGNVYISHGGNPCSIMLANGTYISELASGTNNFQGITLGGGTSFGNNAYVAEVYSNSIKRITPSGTVTTLATLPEQPLVVDIDRTGNYGGNLYAATRNSIKIYGSSDTGSASEFVNFGSSVGGFPLSMAFDTTGRYNGYLYVTLNEITNTDYQGILSVDPQGNVSQFRTGGYWGGFLAFDSTTDQDFGGDLFFGNHSNIRRLTPEGNMIDFLTTSRVIQYYAFGSDGTLYVMEVDSPSTFEDTITISKITVIPEPATLSLLVFGGLSLLRKRK